MLSPRRGQGWCSRLEGSATLPRTSFAGRRWSFGWSFDNFAEREWSWRRRRGSTSHRRKLGGEVHREWGPRPLQPRRPKMFENLTPKYIRQSRRSDGPFRWHGSDKPCSIWKEKYNKDLVKDVAKISTNKLSTLVFDFTFISLHVSTLRQGPLRI